MSTEIVTREMLIRALSKIFTDEISKKEIENIADTVLGYFGFENFFLDNLLSNEDRNLFYFLEEKSILKTENSEFYREKGRLWKIYMWKLNTEFILKIFN